MPRSILFSSLSLCLSAACNGKKISTAAVPEAAGFSAERFTRIDDSRKSWMGNGWTNGAAALIIRMGENVSHNSPGYNAPDITARAKHGILTRASPRRAITSVAAMIQ